MAGDGVSYFATQDSDSSVPDQTSQRATHQMLGFCPVSGLLIQSQISPTERIGHLWFVEVELLFLFFSSILCIRITTWFDFGVKTKWSMLGEFKLCVAANTRLLYDQGHYRTVQFAVQLRLKCLGAIETTQKGFTDHETLREPRLFRQKKKKKSLYSCRGKLKLQLSRNNADHHPLQQTKRQSLLKRLSDKRYKPNYAHVTLASTAD